MYPTCTAPPSFENASASYFVDTLLGRLLLLGGVKVTLFSKCGKNSSSLSTSESITAQNNSGNLLIALIANCFSPLLKRALRRPVVNHEIKRGRPPQTFASRIMKSAIIRACLWLCLELPIHRRHCINERAANAEERAGRRRPQHWLPKLVEDAGLDDGNGEARFCKAHADGITCSPSTNDNIVVSRRLVRRSE